MKKYIDLENSIQKLELSVYYSLGGMNYFNYKQEPRGYYGSVTPVTLSDGMISFAMFSGFKCFLLETKRKSDKAYQEAIKLFETKKDSLIAQVKDQLNINTNGKEVAKKLGISIPPRFYNLTEAQLRTMPIQIVTLEGVQVFDDLGKCTVDLSELCGAMYGEVNGKPCLRFESQEACNMLSN